jgi:outer membrane protein OmpA-like peptidoglycan-associated protein
MRNLNAHKKRLVGEATLPLLMLLGFVLIFGQPLSGQSVDRWLIKGDQAFAEKEYLKAIDYYGWAEQKTGNWKASLGLANSHRARLQYAQARIHYEKVVAHPDVPINTYFYFGQCLMVAREYAEAEKWFAKYAKEAPLDPRATTFRDLEKLVTAVMRDSAQYDVNPLPINSPWSDFSPAYFQNGILFVSARPNEIGVLHSSTLDDAPLLDLYFAQADTQGQWSKPKPFGELNTKLNEGPLVWDSRRGVIYLTRNDPQHKKNKEKETKKGINRLQIEVLTLQNGTWVSEKPFPVHDKRFAVGHPALSSDGNQLIFASDMPGGMGGTDLYKLTWDETNGMWSLPENLGPVVNTSENELFPYIDAESQLYFASNGHLGLGGLDIFCVKPNGNSGWGRVQNLGYPLNSETDDFGLVLQPDGNEGLLSSNRLSKAGDDNIYSFKRFWPRFECAPQLKNNYCFQFWETGVVDADTMPLAYEWDFGDGFKARGLEARHCYEGPGDYLVSLNLIDTVSGYIFLNQTEYSHPVRDTEQVFIDCPDIVGVGQSFAINSNKSIAAGCELEKFYWELGDGTRETLPEFTHQFDLPGSYEIKLGVDGTALSGEDYLCKSCVTKIVKVIPLASFERRRDSLQLETDRQMAEQAKWDRPQLVQNLLDAGARQFDMRDSLENGNYSVLLQKSSTPIDTRAAAFGNLRDLREVQTPAGYEVHSGLEGSLKKIAPYFFEGHRAGFEDAIVVVVRDSSKTAEGKLKVVQIPAKKTELGYTIFAADVRDAQGNPLQAELTFEELHTGIEVITATADSSGKVEVQLPNGNTYAWYLGTTDYFPASGVMDLIGVSEAVQGPRRIRNKVTLSSIAELMASGAPIRINNVFFDFDAVTLRPESKRQLDRLADLLLQYTDYGVFISAHTDDAGTDNYNLILSRRRANSVLEYLSAKGFSAERVKSEGFGERKPAVANDSPENRQFNRRVEFSLYPLSDH